MRDLEIRFIPAVILIAFVSIVIAFVSFPVVSAQKSTTSTTGGGNNLKISPLRTDLTLRPGESRSVSVTIENLETKPVYLKPIQNDFIAGNEESGDPAIILDENEFAPSHSLKRFMEPLSPILVQGGEQKEVKVVINVPQDAAAGGYYGALRFAPAKPDGSAVVNVSGSVASLIILTVPGNLTESLQLTDFSILQDGKQSSRLNSPEKVSVLLRLENKGNVQLAPYGNLSVIKDGSTEPVFSTNINDIKPAGLVLPDSARKFDIPVKNLDNFGKYTFRVVLGYGTNNETIEVEKTVWIIPSTYIVGGIIGVTFLIVLVTAIVLGLRAYKKRIIRHTRRR